MADEVIFVIDGSAERGGAVPADVFLAKLRSFISMIYAFDRAFAHREKRSVELEIVTMSRSSPAQVGMRVRTTVPGYPAEAAMEWTFSQLSKIQAGEAPDKSVPLAAIDNVIDLATYRPGKLPALSTIEARYKGVEIVANDDLANRAMSIRSQAAIDDSTPWHSGVSRGELFGELRGAIDFEGEREFFIVPPSGPSKVRCVFPEELRAEVQAKLWTLVRAAGFLQYDGKSPFPHLLNADSINAVTEPEGHFSDMRGAFKDFEDGRRVEWRDD